MGNKFAPLIVAALFTFALSASALLYKADQKAYLTGWSVVDSSFKEATVVKSQLGMKQHVYPRRHSYSTYYEYTSFITIKTKDGKTGTFIKKTKRADCRTFRWR